MKAAAFESHEINDAITVKRTLEDYLRDLQEVQAYRREELMNCDKNDTESLVKCAKKLQQTLCVAVIAALQVVSDADNNDIILATKKLLQSCLNDAAMVECCICQEL